MIILITGASHTGKTVLAQKLLEKYKFPYLKIASSASYREFPGGPVVRSWYFQRTGSIPGQGPNIPQGTRCGQKLMKKKCQVQHGITLNSS